MEDTQVVSERRSGGVKAVFDVARADQDAAATVLRDAGFDVRPYYPPDRPPRRGGAAEGFDRWGAERPLVGDVESTRARVERDFAALNRAHGSRWTSVGTDVWEAGGGGPAGVREPRRPLPRVGSGAATADG